MRWAREGTDTEQEHLAKLGLLLLCYWTERTLLPTALALALHILCWNTSRLSQVNCNRTLTIGSSLDRVARRSVQIITTAGALLVGMVWQPAVSSRLLPAGCWQCQGSARFNIRSDIHSEPRARSMSPVSACTHPCYTRLLQLTDRVILGSHNAELSPLQAKVLSARRDRTWRQKSQKVFPEERGTLERLSKETCLWKGLLYVSSVSLLFSRSEKVPVLSLFHTFTGILWT